MKQRQEFSWFSQWTFIYFTDLVKQGLKQDLIMDDFPNVEEMDNSEYIASSLQDNWNQTNKLNSVIFRVFGSRYAKLFIWYFVEMAFKIATAVLLGQLLSWITLGQNISTGMLYAFGMLACKFISMMIHHAEFFVATRMGMQTRVGLIGMIYKKCLLLSGSDSSITGVVGNIF
jgi:ATP-binding cassette subfamily C (CFTR/MRP) protein 4